MYYWYERCLDAELSTEVDHTGTGELGPVVSHKTLRKTKPANNLFPVELFYPVRRDFGGRLRFDPFGEVVYAHNKKF